MMVGVKARLGGARELERDEVNLNPTKLARASSLMVMRSSRSWGEPRVGRRWSEVLDEGDGEVQE